MSKFKPGDKVRRVKEPHHLGPDFGIVGNVYTVFKVTGLGLILEELPRVYCVADSFELVTKGPQVYPRKSFRSFMQKHAPLN